MGGYGASVMSVIVWPIVRSCRPSYLPLRPLALAEPLFDPSGGRRRCHQRQEEEIMGSLSGFGTQYNSDHVYLSLVLMSHGRASATPVASRSWLEATVLFPSYFAVYLVYISHRWRL